jgi:hypothetical protein
MTDITWQNATIRLGEIQPWQHNPRQSSKKTAAELSNTLDEFGQPLPFILGPCTDGKYPLYDGHQRYAAWLAKYGAAFEVFAVVASRPLTDTERRKYVIKFHAVAVGQWSDDVLSGWDAGQITSWGVDNALLKGWESDIKTFKELLKSEAPTADAEPQTDRAEALKEQWGTATGQLWAMGDNRLLIGDCTIAENVSRLMDGQDINATVTDPPYGMDLDVTASDSGRGDANRVSQRPRNYKPVIGDDKSYDPACLFELWYAPEMFLWGADYYAEKIPNRTDGSWLVWDKREGIEGVEFSSSSFEMCWSKKKHRRDMIRQRWAGVLGMESQDTKTRRHPTQKPVEVIQWIIEKYTKSGDIVADPYVGSGTTIIGCHNLDRKCFAMEIDPMYGAIILQRFEDATGQTPVLLESVP